MDMEVTMMVMAMVTMTPQGNTPSHRHSSHCRLPMADVNTDAQARDHGHVIGAQSATSTEAVIENLWKWCWSWQQHQHHQCPQWQCIGQRHNPFLQALLPAAYNGTEARQHHPFIQALQLVVDKQSRQ